MFLTCFENGSRLSKAVLLLFFHWKMFFVIPISFSATSDEISDSEDLLKDDIGQHLDFDIEAFPMEEGDRDGVTNMLTQVVSTFSSPLMNNYESTEKTFEKSLVQDDASKYAKDVMEFIEKKSRKFASKEFRQVFEAAKPKCVGLFVNERMLNFPPRIVTPSFKSIKADLQTRKQPYQKIVYIHKLRVADSPSSTKVSHEKIPKMKRKIGKAQKKRLATQGGSLADIIYDNIEDGILTQVSEGEALFFDYPVHSEVESTSKFHTLVKEGKSYKPYRRIIIMDMKRFDLQTLSVLLRMHLCIRFKVGALQA
ncbi:unnamed protein product [Haemonchus placei]|uniref:Protein C10 n=1 Tax=Haemonchus placei TaxID=6290 RepID=A0A0N4X1U6_HAEPC|nr:unnamed protein product [Haemonchus placei]